MMNCSSINFDRGREKLERFDLRENESEPREKTDDPMILNFSDSNRPCLLKPVLGFDHNIRFVR